MLSKGVEEQKRRREEVEAKKSRPKSRTDIEERKSREGLEEKN